MLEKSPIPHDDERRLIRADQQDLARTFPLLKDLFAYVESKGFNADSFSDYGEESEGDNPRAVQLPDNFASLVADYPGDYFIVAYENRNDAYYKPGTRGRTVRLSIVPKRSKSDDRVREIDFREVDPSEGNKIEITLRESINNKSFANINTAEGVEIEQPYGEAKLQYEIGPNGKRTPKESSFHRLDEGLFTWNGKEQPVRWNRNLKISKDQSGDQELVYKDSYIIGRWEQGKNDERAEIKTTIKGFLSDPQSILIEIGSGLANSAQVLYEDKDQNIRVLIHEGINAFKNQLEIIKQDPYFSTLFRDSVDPKELIENLKFKIGILQDDWAKPQNIFSEKLSLGASKRKLT